MLSLPRLFGLGFLILEFFVFFSNFFIFFVFFEWFANFGSENSEKKTNKKRGWVGRWAKLSVSDWPTRFHFLMSDSAVNLTFDEKWSFCRNREFFRFLAKNGHFVKKEKSRKKLNRSDLWNGEIPFVEVSRTAKSQQFQSTASAKLRVQTSMF